MAAEEDHLYAGENDTGVIDESSGSEAESGDAKRAKVTATRGPPSSLPPDVVDAVIKLRVSKEAAFIKAADGRSRNARGLIWDRISAQLLSDFKDRADVDKTALHPRQLGKRWAYVEKQFKVSIPLRCCTFLSSLSLFAAVPGCPQSKWSWAQGATCVCPKTGCT